MHDVANTHDPLTPTLSPSSDKGHWRPVSIETGIVRIKGGYNTRGEAAHSMEYKIHGTTHLFVELDKNAEWFLKGVGGPKVQKGDLKPVGVLDLVRDILDRKLGQEPNAEAAVAGGQLSAVAAAQSEADEDIDPMDELDDLVQAVPTARKKPRTTKQPERAMVEKLVVPTRPRCVGCSDDDKTVVWVYKKPLSEKRGNAHLFLRGDCIDWLLSYAADELSCQGVEPASPRTPVNAQRSGNCLAVADLHLQWDFDAKAWEASFVAGALVGTTKAMSVHDLNTEMWAKLRDESKVQGHFCRATMPHKKNAVKEVITMWCAAIARNEVPEFEATWGSPSSTSRGEPESQDTTVESQEVTDQEVTGNLAVRDMTLAFEEVTETAVAA